jgi:hypothetical protein
VRIFLYKGIDNVDHERMILRILDSKHRIIHSLQSQEYKPIIIPT